MTIKTHVSKLLSGMAVCVLTLAAAGSARANVPVSDAPLFIPTPVDPNVMFVIDDSGSMHWEVTPDDYILPYFVYRRIPGLYGEDTGSSYPNYVASVRYNATNANERATARALRSPAINRSYYDPSVTYRPWVRADGTSFPAAVATAAYHHPVRTGLGTRNLTVNNTESAIWIYRQDGSAYCAISCAENSLTHYPAVYFRHNGGAVFNADNYTQVEIRSSTGSYTGDGRINRTDAGCSAGTCTYAAEIQNFANWYTYYRSRMLASQASIGRAFVNQSERMRVGFGAINAATRDVDSVDTRTIIRGVRPFAGTNRTNFFNTLYNSTWSPANTPLRRALDDAGQYFSRDDNRGPWGAIPGTNDTSPHIECRQSYTILMTDGYWNDAQASTAGARDNVDGTNGPTITGPAGQSYSFEAVTPFRDGRSNTLADVAAYYWKRDLRTNVENRVPSSPENPAFWQHMVTFGIGLGVTGSVNPTEAFAAIGANPPVTINWGDPSSNNAAKLDDLLHASVNSRGGFFSAADPETFARELSNVLQTIVARTLNSGGTAASAARREGDFLVYVPDFDTTDWTGDLKAYRLQQNGQLGQLAWSAASLLASGSPVSLAARKVYATVPQGSNFGLVPLASAADQLGITASDLSAYGAGVTVSDIVDYLRGDHSDEIRNGGQLRNRAKRIGDIIGSQPEVLTSATFGYEQLPEGDGGGTGAGSYQQFIEFKKTRTPVAFVATNNGMLHGFDARPNGGGELFAIIPNSALGSVKELPKKNYQRKFLFDGTPVQADVRVGTQWRTILLAPTALGGRSITALDVTDPATSFGPDNFMWEFQHPGLGLTISRPGAVRLQGGRWAAIFGNGINSPGGGATPAHKASLFVVDINNPASFQRVQAGTAGSAADPNGMTAVAGVDSNFDGGVDIIYGADYHGQVWKFPVSESGVVGAAQLLFSAVDASGNRQQITGQLEVSLHHITGQMVYFGTGRFLAEGDNLVAPGSQVQSLYAIWDNGTAGSISGRSQLQQQTIVSETAVSGGTGRRMSNSPVNWGSQRGWFIDLRVGATAGRGERFIGQPRVFQGLAMFTTFEPLGNPCISGGVNRLYLLNALSGARSLSQGAACPDCGGTTLQEGAPVLDPPVVITPAAPVCRPGIDPGCDESYDDGSGAGTCDPDTDPGCELLPAPGAGCVSALGFVLNSGLDNRIMQQCGRQSWRQIE